MEFKQKAEEKKMSMSKNIARLAVTAGLTAALSFGGVMAPVTMAFAAEGATATPNSIMIKKNDDNGSVKYKAYQIFEADVVDESGKTGKTDKVVSNVKWATGVNDTTRKAIIKAINDYNIDEADNLKTDASPQDVANWLTANITGTTNTTVLKDTDLLNTLAGLVAKDVTPTNPTNRMGRKLTTRILPLLRFMPLWAPAMWWLPRRPAFLPSTRLLWMTRTKIG